MPSSARVPRQALLVVRRRGTLCSRPSARSACGQLLLARSTAICIYKWLLAVEATVERSAHVPPRAQLVDSFSLRIQLLYAYIWLLTVEATAEHSARVSPHALCQWLGLRKITSGAPYACGCATCVATRCSYVRHNGVMRCGLQLPSRPAIITLVSSTF